jgi:hypothetical protein
MARRLVMRSVVPLSVLLAMVAASPGLASGAGRGPSTLPPKVKSSDAKPGTFVTPRGTVTVPRGAATRLGFCGGDDWEPEIAADPNSSYVYAVLSHFVGDPTCDPSSANQNRIYIQVSSDGGATFGPLHVVADVIGGVDYPRQVDCVVTVDDVTGAVHVSFLAYGAGPRADVAVATSTDHGATFTGVTANGPECKNCDHPWLVAHDGNVYVAYAHARNHYLSTSVDGGQTWTETNVLRADAVAFPEGAVLDAQGNAWFAWGDCHSSSCNGNHTGRYRVSLTLAGTSSTSFALVAGAPAGPKCPYEPNCGFAFFGIQDDIAIDAAGNLYLAWQDGQDHSKQGSPPIVQISRCDAGLDCTKDRSWADVGRADDKDASGCADSRCYALFPRVEGGLANQIAVMWMDDRYGQPVDHTNGWNVWMRVSTTGGTTWKGPSTQVSQYDPARPESHPNGYLFPYGDYEGIDILPNGKSAVLIWGEGWNYTGGPTQPGHVIERTLAI